MIQNILFQTWINLGHLLGATKVPHDHVPTGGLAYPHGPHQDRASMLLDLGPHHVGIGGGHDQTSGPYVLPEVI